MATFREAMERILAAVPEYRPAYEAHLERYGSLLVTVFCGLLGVHACDMAADPRMKSMIIDGDEVVFPVDAGESLQRLCAAMTAEWRRSDDTRNEVVGTGFLEGVLGRGENKPSGAAVFALLDPGMAAWFEVDPPSWA